MISKGSPSASVIIVCHNGMPYLDSCLSSVLEQRLPPIQYEAIVVDNGSIDGSPAFVRERFPAVRLIGLERNLGFARACNVGAACAHGRYLAFLNQDTVVHRDWLRALLEAMEADERLAACHSNMIMPWTGVGIQEDMDGWAEGVRFFDLSPWGHFRYVQMSAGGDTIATLGLSGGAFLLRREFYAEFGYVFDEDFTAYCEDLDLGLRVWVTGRRIAAVPGSIVYHDQRGGVEPSQRNLKKGFLASRNRILAFFKNSSGFEFLCMVPVLLVGAVLKVTDLEARPTERLAMGLAMVPVALFSFVSALMRFPGCMERRRDVWIRRRVGSFWLQRRLWKQAGAG